MLSVYLIPNWSLACSIVGVGAGTGELWSLLLGRDQLSVFSGLLFLLQRLRNHIFLVNRVLGPVPQYPLNISLSIAILYKVSPFILEVEDNFL